jgi:serine/threonine-protein kinase
MSLETRFIRPSAASAGAPSTLPADLTDVVLKRIVFLCLTPPVLVAIGNFVNLLNSFALRISTFDYTWLEGVHDVIITVISLLSAWTVHRRRFSDLALIRLGLAYCVFAAVWFAATECLVVMEYQSEPIQLGMSYFSFTLVWVVFFPSIVPMRSRAAIVTILLAAGLSLLTRWTAHSLGWTQFAEGSLTFLSMAMIFSVLMGVTVSNVIYKLGKSVTEAREMGSYRLQKNLGSGGMGEVWIAKHRMLARPAAVKFIKQDVIAGMNPTEIQKLNQRFEHEVQSTAGLQSPHTVAIYDYGVTPGGTFYYVMELLRGIDMETLVERFGPVDPERAVSLVIQACHSLHEAHSRQLIHRDIKPANLFVCEYGEDRDFVKVLDFGLVKHDEADTDLNLRLTRENFVLGTPAYLYPEAITGAHPIDQRSDIYSLGCVTYWLLTGELVFTANNPMAMLTGHATSPPIPPSERTEFDIPEALDEVVLACLAKDPGNRPQAAEDLAERMRQIRFEKPWDDTRARAWWDLHQIDAPGRG